MGKIWGRSSKGSPIKRTFDNIIDNYGHKVLYRRYNVGVESKYYDAATGDSQGGAKWTFTDEVIEVRHDPMSVRGAVGTTIQDSKMYAKSNVRPKRGDVIIELDYDLIDDEPSESDLYYAPHREAFEITEVDIKRGFKGKTEFYLLRVVPHLGDY
tara:strand:+ start:5916 stop:6380 length:465 start_codon:yes stop_codon:yes gene_type:complete